MTILSRLVTTLATGAFFAAAGPAFAEWPERPVTLIAVAGAAKIIPFGARVGEYFGERLVDGGFGQQLAVAKGTARHFETGDLDIGDFHAKYSGLNVWRLTQTILVNVHVTRLCRSALCES